MIIKWVNMWMIMVICLLKNQDLITSDQIDGSTRLIVYNCSNITGIEDIVHYGSKVIIEVSDGCMIVFMSDTFHARLTSYDKISKCYLPYLRFFVYIFEKEYVSIRNYISKILE